MSKENSFPSLKEKHWRTDWPMIVTLSDGKRMPAYPIHGHVNTNNGLCFGEECEDKMWMVMDNMIEHEDIQNLMNGRVIMPEKVKSWSEF